MKCGNPEQPPRKFRPSEGRNTHTYFEVLLARLTYMKKANAGPGDFEGWPRLNSQSDHPGRAAHGAEFRVVHVTL